MLKNDDDDNNIWIMTTHYTPQKVHIPEKYHERIKSAVTQDRSLAVKLDLTKGVGGGGGGPRGGGDATLLLTPGQLIKIKRAVNAGKKVLTIRMSRKQAKANVKYEGGFLSMLMKLATKALPTLLGGLATGLISSGVEKAVSGSGLFLGKRGYGTVRIDFKDGKGKDIGNGRGSGLLLTPVEHDKKYNGLYLKTDDGKIFQGKGLLLGENSPFKNIPILGMIL